jgi:hypothetical protein
MKELRIIKRIKHTLASAKIHSVLFDENKGREKELFFYNPIVFKT